MRVSTTDLEKNFLDVFGNCHCQLNFAVELTTTSIKIFC